MRWSSIPALLVLLGCAQPEHLHRDEQVVFFPTVGYPVQGGTDWVLPIHGWIYESSWLSEHLDEVGKAIEIESLMESPEDRAVLHERLSAFVVEHKEGRQVGIMLGDYRVRLSPALANGHFQKELAVPADVVAALRSEASAPVIQYRAICPDDQHRECLGRVYLLEPEGLSVVSDIDDTIRLTDVNNTKKMLDNTFVQPYRPVPGMAELYSEWANLHQARFHYLSASPAQLATPLQEFLAANGFPEGSLALRTVDFEGLKTILSLLDAPPEYKLAELTWLMRALPGRQYVLIGDSGQNDPEVYGAIARVFRPQVRLILIRDVTCCEGRDSARYQEAFRDIPDSQWVLFRDPAQVRTLVSGSLRRRTREQKDGEPRWPHVFVQQLAAYNY
jgi:hypothetical protein